jgi:hypothetical protein
MSQEVEDIEEQPARLVAPMTLTPANANEMIRRITST